MSVVSLCSRLLFVFLLKTAATFPSPHSAHQPVPRSNGFHVLLSSQPLKEAGLLHNLTMEVSGSSSHVDLQLWRPTFRGGYKLQWFTTIMEDPKSVMREMDHIMFHDVLGMLVSKGDVLGFHISSVIDPKQMLYQSTYESHSDYGADVIYYMEGVTSSLCTISVCEAKMKAIFSRFPSITYRIESGNLSPAVLEVAHKRLELHRRSKACIPNSPPKCSSSRHGAPIKRAADRDNSSSGTEANTDATVSLSSMTISQSSDNSMSAINSSLAITFEADGTSGEGSALSSAAITVITVGSVFFAALIFLLFVLFFCICRKSSENKMFVPEAVAEPKVELSGSNTSNMVASNSVEQSNTSSNNSATTAASRTNNSQTHAYINAEVSQFAENFRPFTPVYVNNDDENAKELFSEKGSHLGSRSREGRGWSVASSRSYGEKIHSSTHNHRQQQRHQLEQCLHKQHFNDRERAKSVSSTSKLKIEPPPRLSLPRPKTYSNNLSSVLTKPLPLPPSIMPIPIHKTNKNWSQPQLTTFHLPPPTHSPPPPIGSPTSDVLGLSDQCLFIDCSGDYTAPVPISERYKYDPKSREMNETVTQTSSIQRQSFFSNDCHDYSDPDDPDHESQTSGVRSSLQYNHQAEDVHPELSSSDQMSGFDGPTDDGLPSFGRSYGYVPTEEQRRMMSLHNRGHYEMADDIENCQVLGYDHLNFFRESDTYWVPAATAEDLYTQLAENKYREIFRHEISVLNSVGAGHFGSVSKGLWFNGRLPVDVAIKTTKKSNEQERVKLLQEAAIMGQFAHNNVVRLHGVVTVGEPVLVALEYMPKGDLQSFLKKLHPKVSQRSMPEVLPSLFVKFSKDIANGMSYLAKKCFIHRDLAARNILLNNELSCKIGDFGMARDIENEGDYYRSHGGMIPVKWTAPEALQYNKYSSASDVWSYGMVLFEIWSLGEKPFSDFSNPIVIALVSSKHCQPPPPGCPRPIYHLMIECWNPEHACRPTFDSIYDYLDSPDESLLQWSPQLSTKCQGDEGGGGVQCLGAPLETANNLYLELQRTYQQPQLETNL